MSEIEFNGANNFLIDGIEGQRIKKTLYHAIRNNKIKTSIVCVSTLARAIKTKEYYPIITNLINHIKKIVCEEISSVHWDIVVRTDKISRNIDKFKDREDGYQMLTRKLTKLMVMMSKAKKSRRVSHANDIFVVPVFKTVSNFDLYSLYAKDIKGQFDETFQLRKDDPPEIQEYCDELMNALIEKSPGAFYWAGKILNLNKKCALRKKHSTSKRRTRNPDMVLWEVISEASEIIGGKIDSPINVLFNWYLNSGRSDKTIFISKVLDFIILRDEKEEPIIMENISCFKKLKFTKLKSCNLSPHDISYGKEIGIFKDVINRILQDKYEAELKDEDDCI